MAYKRIIQGLLEAYLKKKKKKKKKNSDEQEKEPIIRVRVGEKNPALGITICHHSASLVKPNGDPLFYPQTHDI